MGLYGVNTSINFDPWIIRQFQGFNGFPATVGVDGNGSSVLIPGVPPQPLINPGVIASPGGNSIYNVNPLANGDSVFGAGNQDGGFGGNMPDLTIAQVGGSGSGNQGGELGPAVLPQLQPLPSMTAATMPTMTDTANAVAGSGGAQVPAITPAYLNQRLPSIVNPAPMDMGGGCATGITAWVGDNPLIALAGLMLLGCAVWGKGRGGR